MNKIGLFDSGVGGLSILQGFLRKYPNKDFVYFADTLNLPYGDKSRKDLQKCCIKVKDFLLSLGVEALVMTCNSASCLYLDQTHYKNIPLFNVVSPTIKKLMKVSAENDRVGILATPFTVQSNVYSLKIQSIKPQLKVFQEPVPNLASLVERGLVETPECRESLKHHLESLLKKDINILILGCTHYFSLKDQIREFIPSSIKIVDLLDDFEWEDFNIQNHQEQMNPEDIKEKKSDSNVQIYMTQKQPEIERIAYRMAKDLSMVHLPKIKTLNSF